MRRQSFHMFPLLLLSASVKLSHGNLIVRAMEFYRSLLNGLSFVPVVSLGRIYGLWQWEILIFSTVAVDNVAQSKGAL